MKHIALLCLGVALAGCRQDDDVIACTPLPPATPAGLSSAAPSVQTFTFDLGQPQRPRARKGATVAFEAGVLLLPNGTVATGQTRLRLREILRGARHAAGRHADHCFTQLPQPAAADFRRRIQPPGVAGQ